MNHFKQYIPGYVYFPEDIIEADFDTLEEFLEINPIKIRAEDSSHIQFSLGHYDEKEYCVMWEMMEEGRRKSWVVGFVTEPIEGLNWWAGRG